MFLKRFCFLKAHSSRNVTQQNRLLEPKCYFILSRWKHRVYMNYAHSWVGFINCIQSFQPRLYEMRPRGVNNPGLDSVKGKWCNPSLHWILPLRCIFPKASLQKFDLRNHLRLKIINNQQSSIIKNILFLFL